MSEWQPIETAPKDGTWFLSGWTYSGRWIYRLCTWNARRNRFDELPGRWSVMPTHWMPLPEPPQDVEPRQ